MTSLAAPVNVYWSARPFLGISEFSRSGDETFLTSALPNHQNMESASQCVRYARCVQLVS